MSENIEWKKIKEEERYSGYRKIVRRTYELPDGRRDEYDLKIEPDVACVVALTPDQKVIIAKQYRPAQEKVLFELPGGRIEKGEKPEEAIARELLEETGYRGKLIHLGQHYICAYSTRTTHSFLATECEKVEGAINPDQNEFIEVMLMDLDEFKEHVASSGEMTDVATALRALRYLEQ